MRKYRANNPDVRKKERKSDKEHRRKLKFEVLLHYSIPCAIPVPICAECHFSDIRALSLDRINGKHKKTTKLYGDNLYQDLKKKDYPDGWQVLCMNCQWVKRYENKEITL